MRLRIHVVRGDLSIIPSREWLPKIGTQMMQGDARRDSASATHPCPPMQEKLAGKLEEWRRMCQGQSIKFSDLCPFNRVQNSGVLLLFLVSGGTFVFQLGLGGGIQ